MRHKMLKMGILAGVLAVFAVGAVAQHEEHHPQEQANQPQAQSTPSHPGAPGMMNGGMMGMMGQMTNHHQKMSDLMSKLMESMAAIQNEKDPEALKSKLAEHSALLKEMHDQMMQQGTMMQNMSGMMKNMTGGDTKPSTK
jgi:hypothetical protein